MTGLLVWRCGKSDNVLIASFGRRVCLHGGLQLWIGYRDRAAKCPNDLGLKVFLLLLQLITGVQMICMVI